ncbi:MAG: VOC family protein [Acidimicrobiales bacterium]
MTHRFYPSGTPRLNHVALSVPGDLLDAPGRADLCRYFDEVLGFEELPTMTLDGKRLVLSCVHWDQFLFLLASDNPMRAPAMDHYGFAVGSLEELTSARDRAAAFAAKDLRMLLDDLRADDQGPVRIHSIYLDYLLPMRCELQWWEFLT